MAEQPSTISDADWAKLQRASADKTGGLTPTADQKQAAATWQAARSNAKRN